jgi:myo-inositol-1(or 4)-monophosphatase
VDGVTAMRDVMDGFRPETVVGIEAVQRALGLTGSGVGATDVAAKGVRDVVTATDVAVEDAVRAVVLDTLGLLVVGEERGGEAPADGSPYWIVDPICGTRNFAFGIPLYCVNLALVEDRQVTVAVVGDPSTGEVDVAERGRSAWALKGGARWQLIASAESATLVIEDSHSTGTRREQAALFTAAAIRADRWDLRAFSTTLALAYVAAGRVAAYVLFWTSAVHAAAGSLLAAEAGARVSDIEGRPWSLHSDSIVASANPALHQDLLDLTGEEEVGRRRGGR